MISGFFFIVCWAARATTFAGYGVDHITWAFGAYGFSILLFSFDCAVKRIIDPQAMKAWCFHIVIAIKACWARAPECGTRTRRPFTGITALNYELFYRTVIRTRPIFDYIVIVAFIIVLVVRACNTLVIGNKIVAQCAVCLLYTSTSPRD